MSHANAIDSSDAKQTLSPAQLKAVREAGQVIAPNWPLDRSIAVNPLWEYRDRPIRDAAAQVATLRGFQALMPADWFLDRWQKDIHPEHLRRAAAEYGVATSEAGLIRALKTDCPAPGLTLVSDILDQGSQVSFDVPWQEEIVHQISQFCARYFQSLDEDPEAVPEADNLYREWLANVREDRGLSIVMDEPGLIERFRQLPENSDQLIAAACADMGIGEQRLKAVGTALLLSVNGWAAWVAYRRWQARLAGMDIDEMPQLLAIRLAWEWVLWQGHAQSPAPGGTLAQRWRATLDQLLLNMENIREWQTPFWVWQRAAELAYQDALSREFQRPVPAISEKRPSLQAVFCIDVRSERIRRALEVLNPDIQTLGFAGFFGLPLAYQPAGGDYQQPQLPGLLAPQVTLSEQSAEAVSRKRGPAKHITVVDEALKSPASSFSLIEGTGLLYAGKLVKETLFPGTKKHPVRSLSHGEALALHQNGQPLSLEGRVALCSGLLGALNWSRRFARTVLLVGHGSVSRNNPHAAGLDCGACCGQSGELNVRILCDLLNDPEVRQGLAGKGFNIPDDTRFVAALHNTTTDEIQCFERVDARISAWLESAAHRTRLERAGSLGIEERRPGALKKQLEKRGQDWSQVRPEWGLANNAAFVVAPRWRTRHLNLQGRSFLHDYDWQADPDLSVLTTILTAPMVVTHWINMQYNLSVTDNEHWGSGNKVLHNVVGQHLGVFEGNGGDLRIGLPRQSVHDGQHWLHQPQRLSVYVAAPREAIEQVSRENAVVRMLIDNEWLFLLRIGEKAGVPERYFKGEWTGDC